MGLVGSRTISRDANERFRQSVGGALRDKTLMMTRWIYLEWWRYLLMPARRGDSWWIAVRCRMKGHPNGVVWYNTGALEPNMHCQDCGDDLG
jgi:hypothetical protein